MGRKESLMAEAAKILDKLLMDPDSEPFREPVQWKEWGLLDYPKIVKEPMDLGTIKRNFNRYKDVHEFARHVKLVWKNCMAYNAEKSDYWNLANKLDKRFDREMQKIVRNTNSSYSSSPAKRGGHAISTSHGRGPTTDEKAAFCKMIYDINEVHLGQLIQVLDDTCEGALEKPTADNIEIDVDAIDLDTFRKLETMVKDFLAKEKGGPSRKRKNDPALDGPEMDHQSNPTNDHASSSSSSDPGQPPSKRPNMATDEQTPPTSDIENDQNNKK